MHPCKTFFCAILSRQLLIFAVNEQFHSSSASKNSIFLLFTIYSLTSQSGFDRKTSKIIWPDFDQSKSGQFPTLNHTCGPPCAIAVVVARRRGKVMAAKWREWSQLTKAIFWFASYLTFLSLSVWLLSSEDPRGAEAAARFSSCSFLRLPLQGEIPTHCQLTEPDPVSYTLEFACELAAARQWQTVNFWPVNHCPRLSKCVSRVEGCLRRMVIKSQFNWQTATCCLSASRPLYQRMTDETECVTPSIDYCSSNLSPPTGIFASLNSKLGPTPSSFSLLSSLPSDSDCNPRQTGNLYISGKYFLTSDTAGGAGTLACPLCSQHSFGVFNQLLLTANLILLLRL